MTPSSLWRAAQVVFVRDRQPDEKCGASAHSGLIGDAALIQPDAVGDDLHAQSAARATFGVAAAKEWLEQVRAIRFGDSDPLIPDGKHQFFRPNFNTKEDFAARR